MRTRELNLGEFSHLEGQECYDFDLPALVNDIRFRFYADRPCVVFAVGPEVAVPLVCGTSGTITGLYRGCSSFRLVPSEKSAFVAYSLFCTALRTSQPNDPQRIVVPVELSGGDNGSLSSAVRAMVRQQLQAYGINPDSEADFADGDMSFEDEDAAEFGLGWVDDDEPPLPFEKTKTPAEKNSPPPPKQEAPAEPELETEGSD